MSVTPAQLLADLYANTSGYMRYNVVIKSGAEEACEQLRLLKMIRFTEIAREGTCITPMWKWSL